jgi:hypothetical protein
MEVLPGQGSGVRSLAYNPAIVTISDNYGAIENATPLGRLFAEVNVPGEQIHVKLSGSLAALAPGSATLQFDSQSLPLTLQPTSDPTVFDLATG